MGREKRKATLSAGFSRSKERRRRAQKTLLDPLAPVPEGLVAKPAVPKSKHYTYFEFVENKDKKKKKLEYQITSDKTPPPGFEFVPIGNPVLTSACKELSREKDAMIFIVSSVATNSLSQQVNRLGHHVRETIVEEARQTIADLPQSGAMTPDGKPEPIPECQVEYHAQADAALRDLFPRIPNTDRQIIIEHAFTRRASGKGEQPVGFSDDIPLARRVQLAVLAHIRHSHTRYDDLLKEAGWQAARKAVEELCLDILVKWRGDEETGRDQLDEILREVVIISDSEDGESDDETSDGSSSEESGSSASVSITQPPNPGLQNSVVGTDPVSAPATRTARNLVQATGQSSAQPTDASPKPQRKNQRGFKRYYRAWQEAILRSREPGESSSGFTTTDDAEYDPMHPQIYTGHGEACWPQPMAHNVFPYERPAPFVGYQVSNGRDNRISPSYPRPVDSTCFANHAGEAQPGRNGLAAAASYEDQARGPSASSRILSPNTHRLRDVLVPSIEPASPETMKPAFIRTVPPRNQESMDHVVSQTQGLFYKIRSLSPRDPLPRNAPGQSSRRVVSDHAAQMVRTGDFAPEGPFYAPRDAAGHPNVQRHRISVGPPPSDWSRQHDQPGPSDAHRANRIVVNASRPGTLLNPILMEDRGGFFERVALVPESRAFHNEGNMVPSQQEPFTATQSYRVVSSTDGASMLRGHHDQAGSDVFPASRSGPAGPAGPAGPSYSSGYQNHQPYSHGPPRFTRMNPYEPSSAGMEAGDQHMPGQHPARRRPAQQGRSLPAAEAPPQNQPASYRPNHGKRPAEDDHYSSTRRSRPKSRQADSIIVLD
ncbi:uncharacterized protein UV8b_06133 [Ustilaginoidea virens]|uniref:DUF2293 domain-containing protein n=1 Tax=Ustilaginoidea virens TaxID=1159556 RepID=A0A8E5MJR4_USTVR|nr:uncharacterized protein UV8b_06133 [Ustilaginoidea virens]QUC21892.1 hypothetical protein UV8b_06133 [Ustilaginoidea virens]